MFLWIQKLHPSSAVVSPSTIPLESWGLFVSASLASFAAFYTWTPKPNCRDQMKLLRIYNFSFKIFRPSSPPTALAGRPTPHSLSRYLPPTYLPSYRVLCNLQSCNFYFSRIPSCFWKNSLNAPSNKRRFQERNALSRGKKTRGLHSFVISAHKEIKSSLFNLTSTILSLSPFW